MQDTFWLDHKRQRVDPLADQVITDLFAQEGRAAVQAFFEQLIRQIELPLGAMPERIKTFFSEASTFPDWADSTRLMAAERVFLDHGPKMLLLLYFKSLPTLYLCANGAEVLRLTGRLSPQREGHEVFARRVAETGQFLLHVMSEGGLRSCGPGLHSLLRVRLIHAAIRQFIPPEQWGDAWGRPINQEDLAITLMTFSLSLIDGLAQLGAPLTGQEGEDYLHAWCVAGHFLGIDPDLRPDSVAEGRQLLRTILARQAAPSEAGQLLTQALVAFAQEAWPGDKGDATPEVMIRYLIGDEHARMLGLDGSRGCLTRLVPGLLQRYFGWSERLEDRFPNLRDWSEKMSRRLVWRMVGFFDRYKQRHLTVPTELARSWGLTQSQEEIA